MARPEEKPAPPLSPPLERQGLPMPNPPEKGTGLPKKDMEGQAPTPPPK